MNRCPNCNETLEEKVLETKVLTVPKTNYNITIQEVEAKCNCGYNLIYKREI